MSPIRAAVPAVDVLSSLRDAIASLGVRRPNRLQEAKEAQRTRESEALAVRLRQESLIPGLTVFQEKGREWLRVGVEFTRREESLLSTGVRALDDENCVVSGALTRTKERCVPLFGHAALELEIENVAER